MILTSDTYVPALRWRQGEYQALFRLADSVKNRVVPFITIPEIEFDFEEWKPKKSVQEHIHPFAARYNAKWSKHPAWVEVHKSIAGEKMDDGRDILSYVFNSLRDYQANAVPAIPLAADAPAIHAAASIVTTDGKGVAISVRLEDLMKPDLMVRIEALALLLGVSLAEIDLVIDLGAPNFEPYANFAGGLIAVLKKFGNLGVFRNFVLIGTAIPETFKDVAKGTDEIQRHDWLFYQELVAKLPKDMRRPNFGDYTIVHPKFTPIDMRKIKSAGKIVYTTKNNWFVSKGGAFRDNPEQMHDHCAAIVGAGIFKGAAYSRGDTYIANCAIKKEKPSNQPWWKFVTINHHITHVVDDLATLGVVS